MDESAIRARIQAIDRTLAELQEQLERGFIEFGPYTRLKTDWERQKAELEAQLQALSAPLQDVEFVNREIELHLLQLERLRASRSPYTLVSAPVGYGKSYLLRHLIQVSQADETLRKKWRFRYVDFSQGTGDPIAYAVQAITGRPSPNGPDAALDLVGNYVVGELTAPSAAGRPAALLIFDAVERLGEARPWLYDLLNALRQRTRPGAQEIITVRVIIAGRDTESFWEGYEGAYPRPPAPQRISLSPFDEQAIQGLIWNQAQAVHVNLDDQTVLQIADQVQHLGCGHPTVIRSLVDDLASQSFAVGPPAEYFARCREHLVRTYLLPVAENLLETLDAEGREAVGALCIFRRVNANTVQALVKAGVLPPATNEVDLLGALQRAHLLDGPSIKEPFYRDPLIRRILALNLAHRSPESQARYRRLNKIALELYAGWVQDLGQALPESHLKSIQRLLSILEWLFHALQDEDMDQDELRFGLQEHIRVLSQGGEPSSVADLIADEINQDAEVRYLLCHRLGDDGVAIACQWLQAL